jgi:hypothetical protein
MSAACKTHDALVADWREHAEKHDDDNYRFLRGLKQKSFKKVDRIALELHQEAFGRGFDARHPEGMNVLLCDRSVRRFAFGRAGLAALVGRNNGLVVELPE